MKRKIDKSKLEACKLVWKKRIAAEKGISEKCAEKTVQSCIELIERMLYGNAMIAFHKQTAHSVWNKEPWLDMKRFSPGVQDHFPTDVCGLLEYGATRVETVYDRKPVGMESDCITFNKKY